MMNIAQEMRDKGRLRRRSDRGQTTIAGREFQRYNMVVSGFMGKRGEYSDGNPSIILFTQNR